MKIIFYKIFILFLISIIIYIAKYTKYHTRKNTITKVIKTEKVENEDLDTVYCITSQFDYNGKKIEVNQLSNKNIPIDTTYTKKIIIKDDKYSLFDNSILSNQNGILIISIILLSIMLLIPIHSNDVNSIIKIILTIVLILIGISQILQQPTNTIINKKDNNYIVVNGTLIDYAYIREKDMTIYYPIFNISYNEKNIQFTSKIAQTKISKNSSKHRNFYLNTKTQEIIDIQYNNVVIGTLFLIIAILFLFKFI